MESTTYSEQSLHNLQLYLSKIEKEYDGAPLVVTSEKFHDNDVNKISASAVRGLVKNHPNLTEIALVNTRITRCWIFNLEDFKNLTVLRVARFSDRISSEQIGRKIGSIFQRAN